DPSTNVVTSYIDVFDGEIVDGETKFRGSIAIDPTLSSANFVAVDDTRHRVYVTALRATSSTVVFELLLLVYDTDSETVVKTISLSSAYGSIIRGLGANQVTGRVYVSVNETVVTVDGNTNAKIGALAVGVDVGQIAINRKANKVYVANTGADRVNGGYLNRVAVIDGVANSVERTFSN